MPGRIKGCRRCASLLAETEDSVLVLCGEAAPSWAGGAADVWGSCANNITIHGSWRRIVVSVFPNSEVFGVVFLDLDLV